MGPENGRNLNYVSYFPIEEYVDKIKLNDYILEHMEETSKVFDDYLRLLSKYDTYAIMFYLKEQQVREIQYSNNLEKHKVERSSALENDLYFSSCQISNNKIKKVHKIVTGSPNNTDYRTKPVNISYFDQNHIENIYWRGVNSEDIKKFMDDFINFYRTNSVSGLYNNPFLKSALAHLLFVRIHPFSDGNGRTARTIHNIRFTESINKIYGLKLKLCPLNLSQSILLNQPTYAKRINDIYFDLEHDCNDEINRWFDFVLNMVDEQLYHKTSQLPALEKSLDTISKMRETDNSSLPSEAKKLKLKI